MSTDEERGIVAKIEKGMERAIEEYNNNPGISLAITTIPVMGPVIDTIIRDLGGKISQRRFLELCHALKEEISLVDQNKIDKAYLESEEGIDLIRKVFRTALDTAEDEKIRLYSRILIRAALLDNARFRYPAKDFLSILLELSPTDLVVAREIYKQQKDTPADIDHNTQNELDIVKKSGYDNLPAICNLNKADYDFAITKLVRAGLIRQVVGVYYSYVGDAYRITHTFRKLMNLVENLD